MPVGDSDLATFVGDFGEVVSFGAIRARANFDRPVDVLGISEVDVSAAGPSILYVTADLPGLKHGSRIGIAFESGATGAYEVRRVDAVDDGKMSRATLREV